MRGLIPENPTKPLWLKREPVKIFMAFQKVYALDFYEWEEYYFPKILTQEYTLLALDQIDKNLEIQAKLFEIPSNHQRKYDLTPAHNL